MRRHAPAPLLLALALGCGQAGTQAQVDAAKKAGVEAGAARTQADAANEEAELAAERAKLTPADRELVEAQEWCAVSEGSRLGSMGAPLKLDLGGKPAFVCCAGCRKRAEADPAKTLAKVEELRARKAAR